MTSRDSPIHFVIARWRHAREQASGEAAFLVRFSCDFFVTPHTPRYSSLPPEASKGSQNYIKPLTFNLAELPNSVAKL